MKKLPVLLLAVCVAALARPASWYWYESLADGHRVCSQTPLGPGWKKGDTAYADSRCTKLARAQ